MRERGKRAQGVERALVCLKMQAKAGEVQGEVACRWTERHKGDGDGAWSWGQDRKYTMIDVDRCVEWSDGEIESLFGGRWR
jgi:hypothetical protein